MSRTIHVDLKDRGYDIRIGRGMAFELGEALKPERSVLLVSDSNVAPLYADACKAALERRGCRVHVVVVPAGESSKTLTEVQRIYDEAVAAGLDRRGVMVALGGGVIGDLTGFAAATYLRGVRFVQIPTTLLAMVDSSVGGKTGVNIEQGKNLVGAFHQPEEVLADLSTLDTLPAREYAAGLSEVVKYGVIWDATLFGRLEAHVQAIKTREAALMEDVVARCCEIKAEVVAVDERESGVRAILNFGHTLGHALEKAGGYGRWLHGEAVSLGMVYAAVLSARVKGFSGADVDRLRALLEGLGLPVSVGNQRAAPSWNDVRAAMATDKKNRSGMPRFVLAEKMGAVMFGCEVPEPLLEESYAGLSVS